MSDETAVQPNFEMLGEDSYDKLPPLFDGIKDGQVEWMDLNAVDFALLGLFLSSHLIIEHYVDAFMAQDLPQIQWKKAKLQFATKLDLISNCFRQAAYDPIPSMKHFNSVRNRLAHRVNYALTDDDFQPLIQFIKSIGDEYPEAPPYANVLREYTTLVCAFFGGGLAAIAHKQALRSKKKPT
jgi:hypothetical protein